MNHAVLARLYQAKPDSYFEHCRPEMAALVPTGARRVLDVGCGRGAFGAALREKRGCEVVGIELDGAAADIARCRLDAVHSADMMAIDDASLGRFDCVVFNDVLEHLIDPWRAVARAHDLLRPDGCVVASIPNIRHYRELKALIWDGLWRYEHAGVLDRTHLRFFTRATAIELFESVGFEVQHVE